MRCQTYSVTWPSYTGTHCTFTPSSVTSRPTCFSSSLCCCWQVGSAPFVRRRYDCSASSAQFRNIQTYLLTYLPPAYLDNVVQLVNRRTMGPGLCSENSLNCYIPRVFTKLGEHAFSYAGPAVLNNLSVDIRAAVSMCFTKNLKTYCFRLAFDCY